MIARQTIQLFVFAWAIGLVPAVAHAQTASACRPADNNSARIVLWLTDIATGVDSAAVQMRAQLKIPKVVATQVTYVTSNTTCNKALNPYNANSAMSRAGFPVAPSGKLYVVKVGTVYVANDPVKSAGEFTMFVTMSSSFKLLARSLG